MWPTLVTWSTGASITPARATMSLPTGSDVTPPNLLLPTGGPWTKLGDAVDYG